MRDGAWGFVRWLGARVDTDDRTFMPEL
jgi:hypothetical protein